MTLFPHRNYILEIGVELYKLPSFMNYSDNLGKYRKKFSMFKYSVAGGRMGGSDKNLFRESDPKLISAV